MKWSYLIVIRKDTAMDDNLSPFPFQSQKEKEKSLITHPPPSQKYLNFPLNSIWMIWDGLLPDGVSALRMLAHRELEMGSKSLTWGNTGQLDQQSWSLKEFWWNLLSAVIILSLIALLSSLEKSSESKTQFTKLVNINGWILYHGTFRLHSINKWAVFLSCIETLGKVHACVLFFCIKQIYIQILYLHLSITSGVASVLSCSHQSGWDFLTNWSPSPNTSCGHCNIVDHHLVWPTCNPVWTKQISNSTAEHTKFHNGST